ncbi:MAG: DegT/DnrJ/EryC1/StrS family aminotransferase [Prevotella sp.]|nr:DegT/DnrJ/EryC1/StrS family aminotransferase [Prevotella sp.]
MDIEYLSLKRVTAMHGDEIHRAVTEVVDSGRYLQGERVAAFEREFAAYTGRKYCVTTGNGLDALTVMIRAYKEQGLLADGDEVIVPANTFIATILSITANRLTPVLVEPRITDFQIDDELIEQAVTPRTKAVMIVHLYGYDALTDKIISICRERDLLLLEDCAQAHGLTRVAPRRSMNVPGAQAYSFYPGKNLGALADAGAITTDDERLADAARAIANYGSSEKYVFRYRGRNTRMDELSAAVLSVKLKYLDAENRRRQQLAEQYIKGINNPEITLPPPSGVHHIFPVLCPDRDELGSYLAAHGIQTLIHYPIPPHKQACYPELHHLRLPVTERIHREELSLPLNQAMTDEEVNYIITTLNGYKR